MLTKIPLHGCEGCTHFHKYRHTSNSLGRCENKSSDFFEREIMSSTTFCSSYEGELKSCVNCVYKNTSKNMWLMNEVQSGTCSNEGPQEGIFHEEFSQFYCSNHIARIERG